jgi:hypothetical protein
MADRVAREPVFLHFDNDAMRDKQIRNMGVVEGDEPVLSNEWEQIRRMPGTGSSIAYACAPASNFETTTASD